MSQYDFGTIDPFVVDGTTLAGMLNNWRDALYSLHRGASRPDYAVPGLLWINDAGGPTNWLVNIYLGPSVGDRPILQINTTTSAIAQVADQVTAALLSAQASAGPAFVWNATGNAANQKLWKAVLLASGVLQFQALNDAQAVLAGIDFNRDGTMRVVAPAPTDNSSLVPTTAWVKANVSVGGVATPTYDSISAMLTDSGTAPFASSYVMQITHGVSVWSRSFTAIDPTHPIEIDITLFIGTGSAGGSWNGGGGLFIDGAAAAVAQGHETITSGWLGAPVRIYWQGVLAAGPHTFAVRFGGSSLTFLNGAAGIAQGGGALRSTMTIREVGVGAVGPQGPPGPTGGPVTTPTYDTLNVLLTDPSTFAGASGDNVMQITNGTPVFSRSFTAVDATHPIEVDVTLWPGAAGAPCWACGALFIDGAALAVGQGTVVCNSQWPAGPLRIYWQGVLAAGAHTFAVRFGSTGGGAAYLNGWSGNRLGGGAQRNSMVIREIGLGPKGPQGDPGLPFQQAYAYVEVSGGVPTIRKQFGMASCVRTALGNYTMTMNPAMPDAFYRIELAGRGAGNMYMGEASAVARSAMTFGVYFGADNAGGVDPAAFSVTAYA